MVGRVNIEVVRPIGPEKLIGEICPEKLTDVFDWETFKWVNYPERCSGGLPGKQG